MERSNRQPMATQKQSKLSCDPSTPPATNHNFRIGDRVVLQLDLSQYHPELIQSSQGVVLDLAAHGTTDSKWVGNDRFAYVYFERSGYHDILWDGLKLDEPDLSLVKPATLVRELLRRNDKRVLWYHKAEDLIAELTARGYTTRESEAEDCPFTEAEAIGEWAKGKARARKNISLEALVLQHAKLIAKNQQDVFGWSLFHCSRDGSKLAIWSWYVEGKNGQPRLQEGFATRVGQFPADFPDFPPL